MRLVISFILSSVIYSLIVYFFLFYLIPKKKHENIVYVHTAIIAPKAKINRNGKKKKKTIKQKTVSKIKKTIKKKIKKAGSKSDVTHGGKDIGFNDIFKNVDYNVNTKKYVPKKQLDMSRLKGIERDLKKIKKISFQVNFVQQSGKKLSKKEINDIISQKLYVIWDNISTLPTDYAKINIQSIDGKVYAVILDSNLKQEKQNELVRDIQQLHFKKNFNITVIFQSKVDNG